MITKSKEEGYLQAELKSLGIQPKRTNELNDEGELEALSTAIKEIYFQDYKTLMTLLTIQKPTNHTLNT